MSVVVVELTVLKSGPTTAVQAAYEEDQFDESNRY